VRSAALVGRAVGIDPGARCAPRGTEGVAVVAGFDDESVRVRVRVARRGLANAAGGRDPSALAAALDELEDALYLARVNGVSVPAPDEVALVETDVSDGERG
jgi:hypothetical protein